MSRRSSEGETGGGADSRRARWPEYESILGPVAPRLLFLRVIQRRAPAVLETLSTDVGPEFVRALTKLPCTPKDVLQSHSPEYHPTFDAIGRTIDRWAVKFQIYDSIRNWEDGLPASGGSFIRWLIPVALDTLAAWSLGSGVGPLEWNLSRVDLVRDAEHVAQTFELRTPRWEPRTESKSVFRQKVRALFERALESYLSQVESRMIPEPIKALPPEVKEFLHPDDWDGMLREMNQWPAPYKKSGTSYTSEHFAWFVDYQVRGLTYAAIARTDAAGRTFRAVMAGVKQAAEQVFGRDYDRWLRKSPRGRPRRA